MQFVPLCAKMETIFHTILKIRQNHSLKMQYPLTEDTHCILGIVEHL